MFLANGNGPSSSRIPPTSSPASLATMGGVYDEQSSSNTYIKEEDIYDDVRYHSACICRREIAVK